MYKHEYLSKNEVKNFLNYFKDIVFGDKGSFNQNYTPKKDSKNTFNITCFKEAFDNYLWEGNDYNQSKVTLDNHAFKLRSALDTRDDAAALIQSLKVLDWGGVVVRHPVRWLVESLEKGTLCEKLNLASSVLDSDDEDKINLFDENKILRSDSATTKLFSLIGNRSIIYDDRVGAALARIVREFLEVNGFESVPLCLNFMRGSKNRNPSTKRYRFYPKKAGALHAKSNIRANWLLFEIAKSSEFNDVFNNICLPEARAEEDNISDKVRMLESALFMIGYDILTIDNITIKKREIPVEYQEVECILPKVTNHSKIYEYLKQPKNVHSKVFNYDHIINLASTILPRTTKTGQSYATLKFIQQFCFIVNADFGEEFKNTSDPRDFNKLDLIRRECQFELIEDN
ncbi:hypothetical protein [Colwellia sp. BRX8-9]|uniref:hypothetical protein n=1 Tax=Colwellia sp. BRX8-9 TaxID=2759831 RepID=UPI0015F6FA3B|nr:hypothetical protein [Colwellia sp. BRX8-9]MBA6350395.1 hypothetical protein [Colwellia sp. BRX8-9]